MRLLDEVGRFVLMCKVHRRAPPTFAMTCDFKAGDIAILVEGTNSRVSVGDAARTSLS